VYGYGTARNYYGSVYDGYGDETAVDYSNLSYPMVGGGNMMQSYAWTGRSAGKQPYMDSDTGYSYATAASGSSSGGLTRSPPTDSTGFSMSGFGAALPSGGGGSDRMLPTPVGRTPLPSGASYRADSLGYNNKQAAGASAASVATSPTSPVSDANSSAYSPSEASPMPGYPQTVGHRPSYASSYADAGSEAIFSEQERGLGSQGPAVDMHAYSCGGASTTAASSLRTGSAQTYIPAEAAHHTSAAGGFPGEMAVARRRGERAGH
jgi:hypothetical protein